MNSLNRDMNQQNKTERWEEYIKEDLYAIGAKPIHFKMNNAGVRIINKISQLLSDARREERERIKNGIEGWWNENGGYHWASPWGLFLKKLLKASQPLTTAEESIKKLK